MYVVKIMNEFLHGAVWVYENGIPSSWDKLEADPVLSDLNQKTMELYASYFEFDTNGESYTFNEGLEKETKGKMLSLIGRINKRLRELNNGDFEIEDYETERLMNL